MKTYILRRLLQVLPVLFLVPLFTFLLIDLAPGNV
ncbi:MAG: ABC transporter permease, partial [Candidatus Omnitrophica bacterium]|nr:ABC transporter permease [Candidatus Omnitrophota bacterium]